MPPALVNSPDEECKRYRAGFRPHDPNFLSLRHLSRCSRQDLHPRQTISATGIASSLRRETRLQDLTDIPSAALPFASLKTLCLLTNFLPEGNPPTEVCAVSCFRSAELTAKPTLRKVNHALRLVRYDTLWSQSWRRVSLRRELALRGRPQHWRGRFRSAISTITIS